MDSVADREPLLGFYRATGGPNWYRTYDWNTKIGISSWYGVKCSRGRVVGLVLSSNNLQGDALMSLKTICLMAVESYRILNLKTNFFSRASLRAAIRVVPLESAPATSAGVA